LFAALAGLPVTPWLRNRLLVAGAFDQITFSVFANFLRWMLFEALQRVRGRQLSALTVLYFIAFCYLDVKAATWQDIHRCFVCSYVALVVYQIFALCCRKDDESDRPRFMGTVQLVMVATIVLRHIFAPLIRSLGQSLEPELLVLGAHFLGAGCYLIWSKAVSIDYSEPWGQPAFIIDD
jgi:hypothetical protein